MVRKQVDGVAVVGIEFLSQWNALFDDEDGESDPDARTDIGERPGNTDSHGAALTRTLRQVYTHAVRLMGE